MRWQVILQTQRELMMEDEVMRTPIPRAGLLPGGTTRKSRSRSSVLYIVVRGMDL